MRGRVPSVVLSWAGPVCCCLALSKLMLLIADVCFGRAVLCVNMGLRAGECGSFYMWYLDLISCLVNLDVLVCWQCVSSSRRKVLRILFRLGGSCALGRMQPTPPSPMLSR